MNTTILSVKNLNKTVYLNEPLTILHDISFSLQVSKSLAIIGSSGSGKSTLLGLLASLDTPTSGNIEISGQIISDMNEDEKALFRAQNIGFVFQSFQLVDTLTALENIMLPLELVGDKNAKKRALELIEQVGLNERKNHYPKQLSGGEQQRIAIARAFASNPKILFADEPTGNLDSKTGEKIIELLFELNKKNGTTLILVTHEERLANLCECFIQIESGTIVARNIN